MGQYYRTIMQKENGKMTIFNRNLKRGNKEEYTFAKLMEHSWWYNEFVNAVCLEIYQEQKPVRIAWVGDYADNIEEQNDLNSEQIQQLHKLTWDCKGVAIEPTDFTLERRYLVNHSNKKYVDCSEYHKNCAISDEYGDWCIHPLSVLTCIGNGLGCGDYNYPTDDSTADLIGLWAWDEISVMDQPPEGYEKLDIIFKEKGWNER